MPCYDELISLEEFRLTHGYALQVARYIYLDYAEELRNLLNQLNVLLKRNNNRIDAFFKTKEQEIRIKEQEIQAKNQEIRAKELEIQIKVQEIQAKEQEINSLRQRCNDIQWELNRTYDSYNWKVGKCILFLPKKFMRLLGFKR